LFTEVVASLSSSKFLLLTIQVPDKISMEDFESSDFNWRQNQEATQKTGSK
jgi:hypothetical protein